MMKTTLIYLFLLTAIIGLTDDLFGQSHLEWQLNGSDVTTTIQVDNAAGATSSLPEINMNWNFENQETFTTTYRNYKIINEGATGGLKFKFSGNNSTYTNIIGLGTTSLNVYGTFITHAQSTFQDRAIFEDDILLLNSHLSIGTSYGDLTIGSHKFQVKL